MIPFLKFNEYGKTFLAIFSIDVFKVIEHWKFLSYQDAPRFLWNVPGRISLKSELYF